MADNIGQVQVKVVLLDKSPFNYQPKQETAYYFSEDNFPMLKPQSNVFPISSPLNGIRVSENVQGFDNFLVDQSGTQLEQASFTNTVQVFDGSTNTTTTQTVTSELDPSAKARVDELGITSSSTSSSTSGSQSTKPRVVDQKTRDFFTWTTTQNLFVQSKANPGPKSFSQPPAIDNAPEWTYVTRARPGDDTKALLLTPFMKKNPPDSQSPVHWGAKMTTSMAKNQPFEVTFYYCLRDPAVAKDATPLTTIYNFVAQDGTTPITDLGLTSSIYLAIEIGIGTGDQHYLLLFKNDSEPIFFQFIGSGEAQTCRLMAKFQGFNSSKLFDATHRFFTVKVEPVLGSLIITSNVFDKTPWIILSPRSSPVFVGEGQLGIYSGNVQAGFAVRPIQYEHQGFFTTPQTTYTLLGGQKGPTCSTALKGNGVVEQNKSWSPGTDDSQISMVDAEFVNGNRVLTILDADSGGNPADANSNRRIDTQLTEVHDSDTDPSAQPGPSSSQVEHTYTTLVTMTSGDMTQGNGLVITDGRSPYIWMIRCEVPLAQGNAPGDAVDISCDCMTIDIQHNATSYNEFSHNGTIKMLNKRQQGAMDYRSLTNRAVYIRIEAWWTNGAGFDPGSGNRQIFEGMTVGATVETKAENEIVTFRIEDYMNVLQNSKFVLSPFYDGMVSALAVRDIVLQTGFPDSRIMTDGAQIGNANLSQDLGLPFSNPFEEPQFRFKDGSSYKEAILKIAKLDFKTVYFDNEGNFHYDTMPGGIYASSGTPSSVDFWSSQISAGGGAKPANLVWNVVSFSRQINDVYNVIQVTGVDKKLLTRVSGASAYLSGITDPSSEGYIGFRKALMISDPAYGSIDAVFLALDKYRRRMFIPPLTAQFQTFGYSGLKPLDIVSLDGQPLRIQNISLHINAADNNYWMNVEGEWFFSADASQDPSLTEAGLSGATPATATPPAVAASQ